MNDDLIAVIIPSYNERKNISLLIKKILLLELNIKVVIVDDNSPDNTAELVKKIKVKNKKLILVSRSKKSGRGGAVIEGFKNALMDKNIKYFIEMDADLSHRPEDLDKLIANKGKNKIIIGSRYIKGSRIIDWPLKRKILSKIANYYIKIILGIPVNDLTNGFRCYPRKAVEEILNMKINHKGFIALSETAYQLYKKDYHFHEVPIIFEDRKRGRKFCGHNRQRKKTDQNNTYSDRLTQKKT
jgi:dolichol-phosphate mannosyltransferase